MFGNSAKIQAEAVCWIAARGKDVALRLLLDRGCDPSSREEYPPGPGAKKGGALYRAIECKQWNCVWLLLDRGADVHEAGVLNLAVRANQLALVEEIVRKGVSVDKLDKPGDGPTYYSFWAPLHHAARSGALEMVELLLQLGANVDIGVPCVTKHPEKSASISLMIPSEIVLTDCEEGISLQVLRLLVDGGASINHMDKYGWTALHIAVYRGFQTVATLLLDRGADVNAQRLATAVFRRHPGNTPLHEAVYRNNPDMMELLLGRGANMKAIRPSRLSPLELVESLPSGSNAQLLFSKYH
jgi:ankyrin repeat protein